MTDPILIWDSSGLGKRFIKEPGEDVVNALFRLELSLVSTYLCYIEVASILNRHRNRGTISSHDFGIARQAMERELIHAADATLLSASDNDLLSSISLADHHNLNSNDAVLLYIFRNYVRNTSHRCVLIVADKRFERAAKAEGIECLNPEAVSVAELASLGLTSPAT